MDGSFLFLDTDTIVIRDLKELLGTTANMALAQDQFDGHAFFGFPSWLQPHFQAFGWRYPPRSTSEQLRSERVIN